MARVPSDDGQAYRSGPRGRSSSTRRSIS